MYGTIPVPQWDYRTGKGARVCNGRGAVKHPCVAPQLGLPANGTGSVPTKFLHTLPKAQELRGTHGMN